MTRDQHTLDLITTIREITVSIVVIIHIRVLIHMLAEGETAMTIVITGKLVTAAMNNHPQQTKNGAQPDEMDDILALTLETKIIDKIGIRCQQDFGMLMASVKINNLITIKFVKIVFVILI